VRQLTRQIDSQFYERTLLSKNKAAMLRKGAKPQPGDLLTPEEEIKDPLVLEFLDLKDEYSETDLEAALITKLEEFLDEAVAHYALDGLPNKVRAGEYRLALPDEQLLADQLTKTQRELQRRGLTASGDQKTVPQKKKTRVTRKQHSRRKKKS